MPRGIPNKKRRGRRAAGEETNGVETEGAVDEEGNPVVGGELAEPPPTLGESIEIVRAALEPFDDGMRKRVVRAASMLLKG